MRILLFYDLGIFAETARDFLISWFVQKAGLNGPIGITKQNVEQFTGKGVYFICYGATADTAYPLYVGITRRAFSVRFKEHMGKDGKINLILNSQSAQNPSETVFVATMEMELAFAKFVESTLLFVFDFALNKQENDVIRTQLRVGETFPYEEAQAFFIRELKTFAKLLVDLL